MQNSANTMRKTRLLILGTVVLLFIGLAAPFPLNARYRLFVYDTLLRNNIKKEWCAKQICAEKDAAVPTLMLLLAHNQIPPSVGSEASNTIALSKPESRRIGTLALVHHRTGVSYFDVSNFMRNRRLINDYEQLMSSSDLALRDEAALAACLVNKRHSSYFSTDENKALDRQFQAFNNRICEQLQQMNNCPPLSAYFAASMVNVNSALIGPAFEPELKRSLKIGRRSVDSSIDVIIGASQSELHNLNDIFDPRLVRQFLTWSSHREPEKYDWIFKKVLTTQVD